MVMDNIMGDRIRRVCDTLKERGLRVEERAVMAIAQPEALAPADEVLDFLLSAPTPEQVIALRPSETTQERLRYLLDGNRKETLNDAERAQLDAYLQLEVFVRRLKLRAREKLADSS